MKKYEYNISIPANSQDEADSKMKSVVAILPKLTADELKKIAAVVADPAKLAVVKSQLL